MYFILVRPGQAGGTRQPFTREDTVYLQNLCLQDQSAFLLIFEARNEAEAFEHTNDNVFLNGRHVYDAPTTPFAFN
jgi:hypothetical protein